MISGGNRRMGPGDIAVLHLLINSARIIRSLYRESGQGCSFISSEFIARYAVLHKFSWRFQQSIKYVSRILLSRDEGESAYPDPIGLRTLVTMNS